MILVLYKLKRIHEIRFYSLLQTRAPARKWKITFLIHYLYLFIYKDRFKTIAYANHCRPVLPNPPYRLSLGEGRGTEKIHDFRQSVDLYFFSHEDWVQVTLRRPNLVARARDPLWEESWGSAKMQRNTSF